MGAVIIWRVFWLLIALLAMCNELYFLHRVKDSVLHRVLYVTVSFWKTVCAVASGNGAKQKEALVPYNRKIPCNFLENID